MHKMERKHEGQAKGKGIQGDAHWGNEVAR